MHHSRQPSGQPTPALPARTKKWRGRRVRRAGALTVTFAAISVIIGIALPTAGVPRAEAAVGFEIQSLDGSGNNQANPNWGRTNTQYSRVAPARYADGLSAPVTGPNSRFISNRIYNDANQNVFSERRVTQWGNVWGQFLDHTFGLAQDGGAAANIPFNSGDPLETFTNTLGFIPFSRNAAAPGTGTTNTRQQVNTETSYIDAEPVYGPDATRLEWLRDGSVNGNVTDNNATLMLPGNYLPRRDTRGNPGAAPTMAIDGRLAANPNRAMVAGDVRANENIALTATHTLFAREHNRIVAALPNSLSQEDKFQIARRIIIAEQQYITYNEFLPAMGVALPAYTGYKSNVNTSLSTEFATVGYRAHSQIHGDVAEIETNASRYSQATLDSLRAQGAEVTVDGADADIAVPLGLGFFNPDLVPALQLGPLLKAIGVESEYNNDSMIDNQLRSVLFQVPVSNNPTCLDGPTLPQCFQGVVDLAAIDIERGRDHGIPSYNQLRQAYGLAPKNSFTAITGEATDAFPSDPQLTPGNEINDPNSLDFMRLANIDGTNIALDAAEAATAATADVRRTTVASRLRAIYGNVNNIDAFVGMTAEAHVPGSEFGELQLAIWTRQFQALRDGDRFFYGNDPGLSQIMSTYGIDFHRSLGQVIASNTDIPQADLASDVFLVEDDELPATTCTAAYTVTTSWPGNFQVAAVFTNTGTTTINNWRANFMFANGQTVTQAWNSNTTQSGRSVTVNNASWNATIPPGGRVDMGFNATFDNATNARPVGFTLNGARCAFG
jgi:hypothetical protein